MKIPLITWEDLDIYELYKPINSWGQKSGWEIDQMAFIKVSLYEDEATNMKATMAAIRRFKEVLGDTPISIQKTTIIEKERTMLFTSIQIEYTIEIIANKSAVKKYYDRITGEK